MIQFTRVSKAFGKHVAVTDVSLAVDSGRTVGFVGANGAGKTTVIRLMLGFLRPTSGAVHLMGCDMNDPGEAIAVRAQIGFVPDGGGLDPVLTGKRLLDELAALQEAPAIDRDESVDALQLSPRDLNRPMGRLSRGTRQKINLIQGLQHRPKLLILDEPTEGLDPFAKRALFELLRRAKARGTTIFFSSHVLSELEGICDEVALIRRGKLVDLFGLDGGRESTIHRVRLRLQDGDRGPSVARLVDRLQTDVGATSLNEANGTLSFHVIALSPLLILLADLPVAELTITPLSLEERVMPHYGLS